MPMKLKIVTVVGARPQFVKVAPVSRAIVALARTQQMDIEEILVHTGQHYDHKMSQVFFDELGIAPPAYNLNIGSGPQGAQTGEMLRKCEEVLVERRPDVVLVYGDTNSTLAGALAAAKLHIPVAHVEAGLRSFNRRMPEEVNRVLTDHVSQLLLVPTETARQNLLAEGITHGVELVGDVMYDAVQQHREVAAQQSRALAELGLQPQTYFMATIHRAENTDDPERLRSIVSAFESLADQKPIVWPLHPRTRKIMTDLAILPTKANVRMIEPAPYLDMLMLVSNAALVLTDSGGLQKEAQWLEIPCVTLRDETEWIETVASGWNCLAGAKEDAILQSAEGMLKKQRPPKAGAEHAGAATRVASWLAETFQN